MSEIPEYIWLQVYGDGSPEDGLPDFSTDEITWCQDAINKHDVKYVRADLYENIERELCDYKLAEAAMSFLDDMEGTS